MSCDKKVHLSAYCVGAIVGSLLLCLLHLLAPVVSQSNHGLISGRGEVVVLRGGLKLSWCVGLTEKNASEGRAKRGDRFQSVTTWHKSYDKFPRIYTTLYAYATFINHALNNYRYQDKIANSESFFQLTPRSYQLDISPCCHYYLYPGYEIMMMIIIIIF